MKVVGSHGNPLFAPVFAAGVFAAGAAVFAAAALGCCFGGGGAATGGGGAAGGAAGGGAGGGGGFGFAGLEGLRNPCMSSPTFVVEVTSIYFLYESLQLFDSYQRYLAISRTPISRFQ